MDTIKTPVYIVDENLLISNLKILKEVAVRSGCKILLAQKAFAMYELYPLIAQYLDGTTASGLYEAKLGAEEMGKENHVFSAAYIEEDFEEILRICDHISFNSFSQWEKYREQALEFCHNTEASETDNEMYLQNNKSVQNQTTESGKSKQETSKCPSFGIRINPECTTQDHAIYDPCSPGSRLGVTRENFRPDLLEGISGLHFHTLCEQNSDALITTVKAVEEKFGEFLPQMDWVNFGGGHHITRADYDVDALVECIVTFKEKYKVEVYLEPGEAVALNAGFLISTVLDITTNGITNVILDASAACHMPDVLEMPYRPKIIDAAEPQVKAYTYRLGGGTCLAGDIIGDYSFDEELKVGDKLVFCDMAIYSMVKNNTFNGMKLPSIAVSGADGELRLVKSFGYEEFKGRLS